ncbi:MAG: hypothetical protein EBU73_00340 [Chitinophagia bacterium]|nr:hypothetical protein [Chitinophagia bacterium]
MNRILIIFLVFIFIMPLISMSQGSDMVLLKKHNNRTVKSYLAGAPLHLITVNGERIKGTIKKIDKDSLFINTYDERAGYTMWGTRVWDTLSIGLTKIHMNEVREIVKPRAGFSIIKNGYIFLAGGISYALLHLVNAAYLKQPVDGVVMAKAGGLIIGGWILKKTNKSTVTIGRRYHLQYVPLK